MKIDDTDVAAAAEKLGTLASQAETPAVIRDVAPWLSNGTILQGLGITKAADRAIYTFDDGSTLEPQSVPWYDKVEWVYARETTPLSAQKPGEGFWFTWLEPQKSVYVAFRSYEGLRAKSRELWKLVDAHPTAKVIFDLRNSPGGDYTEGRSFIVEQVKRRPKLKTYALVGVRTFSAAMNNAIDLRNAGATLVGNTIGERPNSYQENDDFTLPSSKILISYSTRFYKFLPEGVPNIVEPDHRVEPTWEDYKAGRDAALEWILADG